MPIFKKKNESFFKIWTPEMAYILGFFTADGNMLRNKRGAHFIEFQITDKELLEDIKKILGSNHKIGVRKNEFPQKTAYRLQIGSKEIFRDLLKLGLTPAKSKTVELPKIPDNYLPHFIRGYFDGDGCVSFGRYHAKDRKNKKFLLATHFTSGSIRFLKSLLITLRKFLNTKGGFIYEKNRSFDLTLSINDSKKLFYFMYNKDNRIFLERKYIKFKKAISLSHQ